MTSAPGRRPTLIIVSGPPGSGKTTLAHQLAGAIGCPALCRDELKEGMVQASPGFVATPSDPLTMRTYPLFFATIRLWLESGTTHVAEAAFQDPLWRRGLEPLADLAQLRIIRCIVADDVARRRQLERLAGKPLRAAHADHDQLSQRTGFDPISMTAPTLDVDTSGGFRPPLADIVAFSSDRVD